MTPLPGGTQEPTGIVGLGSPHGDDRAAWAVVAKLLQTIPHGVRVQVASNPLTVLDAAAGVTRLIVIDACRGAGPAGSIHRFEWPDGRLTSLAPVSNHGVGLTTALELAAALGRLPPRVVIWAIEAESGDGTELSLTVQTAIAELAARVLGEVAT